MSCEYSDCANEGTFAGDECPGSDDESHHCVDCGQLWWDEKGLSCDLCGDYWCVDWQHCFVILDGCESSVHNVEEVAYPEAVCSKCFLENDQF